MELDPCNTEGAGATSTPYSDCAYWAAEKRPDVWVKPGGHVAYVEKVLSKTKIVISSMGAGVNGGITTTLRFNKRTAFIHQM